MKCTLASDETQLGWASATVAPCWWLWWLLSAVKGGVWTPPHLGQPLQPVLTNAHTHVDCCFPISVQAKRSSGAVSATERYVFMQFCVWLLPLFEFHEKRLGPLKTLKIALWNNGCHYLYLRKFLFAWVGNLCCPTPVLQHFPAVICYMIIAIINHPPPLWQY